MRRRRRVMDRGELDAAEKLRALEERLAQLGSLMVAYSGGVDSAFLAGHGASRAGRTHAGGAGRFALAGAARHGAGYARLRESLGMPLQVIATEELDRPEYARNDANRCFHCKDELFAAMEKLGGEAGLSRTSPTG